MKRIIYFATLVLIMTLVRCTTTDDALENDMDPASNRTLTVVAGLPSTGEPGAQSRSITQDANSLDILLRWEVGNTGIKLVFKQGDKLVQATEEASIKSVEQEGRVGSFDVEIPQEIDISQPFDLYGTTSRLIEVGNGKILTGINEYWFTLPSDAQNNLLEVPVYFEAKNVTVGTVPEINFRHLGSLGVITIKSTATEALENRGCSIVKADPESDAFFYDGFAPFQNLLDLEETVVYLENKVLQRPMLSLEPGETKTFVHWLCPNGNPVPETKISLGDVISQNSLPIRDALKIGNAYHVFATWDGQNLTITDEDFSVPDGELPTITMKTDKNIGESIILGINAAFEDWANVWIDLNNNGTKDEGEEVVTFGNNVEYTLGAQTVTIHGKVTYLICSDNQLTMLDVSCDPKLTSMNCCGNQLTALDLSNNTELIWLNCLGNQLTTLDLSNNMELTWLNCLGNWLTALDVSKNMKLTVLDCAYNRLTALDVSKNTELTTLWCFGNKIFGEMMTALVNSLSDRVGKETGDFRVIDLYTDYEWNDITIAQVAIATGKNWLVLDSNGNSYTPPGEIPDEENQMMLTTTKTAEKIITIKIDAAIGDDRAGVWIDLNNNGKRDPEEKVAVFNRYVQYVVEAQDIAIYGKVTYLGCRGNQLTALDVSGNTKLTNLDCHDNQLTTLDVSGNLVLTELSCGMNQLTTLDVSQNTDLLSLACDNNRLTSLDVSSNTKLTELQCDNNPLTLLDVSQNTKLSRLSCGMNQLTLLDVSNNMELFSLSCYSNLLTSLDVSSNTKLTELLCLGNRLTSLNVSSNTNLTKLWCSNNQLTSLDVSSSTKLTELHCGDNQLASLDVYNNSELSVLYCYNNQLSPLDLSNNTKLTLLSCMNSGLTSLDVSNNTQLNRLDCGDNELTLLNVSNNTELAMLHCENNGLTSLDVSNNTKLNILYCYNNRLSSLDVSKNTELTMLWCFGNNIFGEEMTALVNNLPDRNGKNAGSFKVIDTWSNDGNVITAVQVAIATGKNWPVLNSDGNPYPGS